MRSTELRPRGNLDTRIGPPWDRSRRRALPVNVEHASGCANRGSGQRCGGIAQVAFRHLQRSRVRLRCREC